MADIPLFPLDAGGRYRLAYDQNQWTIERRGSRRNSKPPGGDSEGAHSEEIRWRGRWHVGGEKRTLMQYIDGERGPPLPEHKRPRIHLTPEARFRLDALPDTFKQFSQGSIAVASTAA